MLIKPRGRGPGRPPICPEGLTQIRVRLTPDQLAKLDAVADEFNGNRSAAARLILDKLPIKTVEPSRGLGPCLPEGQYTRAGSEQHVGILTDPGQRKTLPSVD